MNNIDKLLALVSLSCLFLIGLSIWSIAADKCEDVEFPPSAPGDAYCLPSDFDFQMGTFAFIYCDDYNRCCYFYMEKYKGEIGICHSADCTGSACVPAPGTGGYFHEIAQIYDECIGSEDDYINGYSIYWAGPHCVPILDPPQVIDDSHRRKWCGKCPDESVCVEWWVIFNPYLTSLCGGLVGHKDCKLEYQDCLGPACFEICGSDGEFLIICNKWKKCNKLGPIT